MYPTDNLLYENLNILSEPLQTVLENRDDEDRLTALTEEFVEPPGLDPINFTKNDFVNMGSSMKFPKIFNEKLGEILPKTIPIKTSNFLGLIELGKRKTKSLVGTKPSSFVRGRTVDDLVSKLETGTVSSRSSSPKHNNILGTG